MGEEVVKMKKENDAMTNVNQSGYKIRLVDSGPIETVENRTNLFLKYFCDFQVEEPNSSESEETRIYYDHNFIDAYWNLSGPDMHWTTKAKKEIDFLVWWGWLKIKKIIDQGGFLGNQEIEIKRTNQDLNWARSVERQIDEDICSQIQGKGYLFFPQRKIGFRP